MAYFGCRSGRLYRYRLDTELTEVDDCFIIKRDVLAVHMLDDDHIICGQAYGHLSVIDLAKGHIDA